MDNAALYRQKSVVSKYAEKSTRVRQLNIPERALIDHYNIWDKDVLVLGSGAGRVPANLLLFQNRVTAVELSPELHAVASNDYPRNVFGNLSLHNGDARNLDWLPDNAFDVALFPMNGIDLAQTIEDRETILRQMVRKVKHGGILAFSSHNITAYAFSRILPKKSRYLSAITKDYTFENESVLGGGVLFKGSEHFVINQTERVTETKIDSVFCDCRSKLDHKLARVKAIRRLWFPYIMYAFRKH